MEGWVGLQVHLLHHGHVSFVYQDHRVNFKVAGKKAWNLVTPSPNVIDMQLRWRQVHFSYLGYDATCAATVAAPKGRRRRRWPAHVACPSDLMWRIYWAKKKHACISCPRVVCLRLKGTLVLLKHFLRHLSIDVIVTFPLDVSLGPTKAVYNDFLLFSRLLVNFAAIVRNHDSKTANSH